MLLFIFLMISSFPSIAQTFSFEILDKNTEQPISFAHIQIENEFNGTVTDQYGRGTITVQAQDIGKSLLISFVGYSSLTLNFQELDPSKTNRYFLSESPIDLDEIQIIDFGMSPKDFINKALSQIEKTFETRKYRSSGIYEEHVVEDGDSTFSYKINLLVDSQGFQSALRKNRFVANDKAYLRDIIFKIGKQKYNLVSAAELLNFELPFGPSDMEEDSFINDFFFIKNQMEQRGFIGNREVSSSDWYFEKIENQDGNTLLKVTNLASSGYFFSYWIDRNSFEITALEGYIPNVVHKQSNPLVSYHPGSIGFRIDYFQVKGLSQLKQLVIHKESLIGTNPIIGRKSFYGKLLIDELTDQKTDKKAEIDHKFVQNYLR
jgi:hypothetical protein